MTTFNHPKPVLPAHLRRQDIILTAMDQALTLACRGEGTGDALAQVGELLLGTLIRRLTPEQRAEEARYDREVREYNAAVKVHNDAIKARRQARVNADEVRKVRAAACPVCYATHPGEC